MVTPLGPEKPASSPRQISTGTRRTQKPANKRQVALSHQPKLHKRTHSDPHDEPLRNRSSLDGSPGTPRRRQGPKQCPEGLDTSNSSATSQPPRTLTPRKRGDPRLRGGIHLRAAEPWTGHTTAPRTVIKPIRPALVIVPTTLLRFAIATRHHRAT